MTKEDEMERLVERILLQSVEWSEDAALLPARQFMANRAYRIAKAIRATLTTPRLSPSGEMVERAFRGHDKIDREALDRYRDMAGQGGHEMAPINMTTLSRLIATIDALTSTGSNRLSLGVEELKKALQPFATFALQGKRGGDFVICKGLFTDMKNWDDSPPRECHLHKDDFLRAREALSALSGQSGEALDHHGQGDCASRTGATHEPGQSSLSRP